jgi:OsmC-like protein
MENQTEQIRKPDVIVRGSAKGFAQEIIAGTHRLVADEPLKAGGTDTGPGPYELLLAALGACTSMTVAIYARGKGWPLETVTVSLSPFDMCWRSPRSNWTQQQFSNLAATRVAQCDDPAPGKSLLTASPAGLG